jgi:hypothetical protein
MVTSAVKTAWGILAGAALALVAGTAVVSVATERDKGLDVLVKAADFYLKSNGQ